jgi:hypothetical protein
MFTDVAFPLAITIEGATEKGKVLTLVSKN